MKKTTRRHYNCSDALLLEAADTMHASLLTDLADFTAFNATIDVAFAADWKLAINTAYAKEKDGVVRAQMQVKTHQVKAALQRCKAAYRDVRYFAKRAFANDPARLGEFGIGRSYRLAGQQQAKMTEFMLDLATVAARYAAQLTAKGASAAVLAEPELAMTAYNALNIDQNITIRQRGSTTEERIILNNRVYALMHEVIGAAQRIYASNPAKLKEYESV
jgi:hypothetical protein